MCVYIFFIYRQPPIYSVHYQGIPVPLSNHQYHFGVRNLFNYVCVFIIVMQGDASLLLILNNLTTDIQQRKF